MDTLNRKKDYRFIEFTAKLLGGGLPHERYKKIIFGQERALSKEERRVKHFGDAFHYLLDNLVTPVDYELITRIYFILCGKRISYQSTLGLLKMYYLNVEEDTHVRATLMHNYILQKIKERKIEFALLMASFILLTKQRAPLIIYEHEAKKYLRMVKNRKNYSDFFKYLLRIEQYSYQENQPDFFKPNQSLESILSRLKECKDEVKKKFGIEKLFIYGSFAKRSNQNQSDLDLLIIMKDTLLPLERDTYKQKLREFLKKKLMIEIDLIDFTRALLHLDTTEMENIITIIE